MAETPDQTEGRTPEEMLKAEENAKIVSQGDAGDQKVPVTPQEQAQAGAPAGTPAGTPTVPQKAPEKTMEQKLAELRAEDLDLKAKLNVEGVEDTPEYFVWMNRRATIRKAINTMTHPDIVQTIKNLDAEINERLTRREAARAQALGLGIEGVPASVQLAGVSTPAKKTAGGIIRKDQTGEAQAVSKTKKTDVEYSVMPIGRTEAQIAKTAHDNNVVLTREMFQAELQAEDYKPNPKDNRYSGSVGWASQALKNYWKVIDYPDANLDSINHPESVVTWTATADQLAAYNAALEKNGQKPLE